MGMHNETLLSSLCLVIIIGGPRRKSGACVLATMPFYFNPWDVIRNKFNIESYLLIPELNVGEIATIINL